MALGGRRRALLALACAGAAAGGCGSADRTSRGQRIAVYGLGSLSPTTRAGADVGSMRCTGAANARSWVHVELFDHGRVVLLPSGIGIAPPRRRDGAYVRGGRCRYPLWTDEPTGLVALQRRGLTLGDLFAVWGRRLTRGGVGARRGAVRVDVGGRRAGGAPAAVPLTQHAQIVVQIGRPAVRPHARYAFPPGR